MDFAIRLADKQSLLVFRKVHVNLLFSIPVVLGRLLPQFSFQF